MTTTTSNSNTPGDHMHDGFRTVRTNCCLRRCCGPTMLAEGYGYALSSFARSPTAILSALVTPLIVGLAQTDALCRTDLVSGRSPGAKFEGAGCSTGGLFDTSAWNDTLFRSLNGTACEAVREGLSGEVAFDIGLADTDPACESALAAYRGATPFTCNCTGTYAFLPSGMRPGTVLTSATTAYYVVSLLAAPVVGALVDLTPHRKRLWVGLATTLVVSLAAFSALGPSHVWAVALAATALAGPAYDLMFLPIVAYLPELHHDPVVVASYSGYAQAGNYVAQFAFGIIMLVITAVSWYLPDSILSAIGVAQISSILCAVWVGVGNWRALSYMDPRPAGHQPEAGVPLLLATYKSLWQTTKMLYREHPMAVRYLVCNLFGGTGIAVNIALLTTFLAVQLRMAGSQIVGVYMIVMCVGAPASLLYGRCVKRIGAKSAYIALMLFSFVCNTGLPFIVNKPEQAMYAYFFAPIAGMYFGLFYAMQSAVFTNFIPVGEEAACYGLQNFSGVVIRWIPPLVYTAIVQATNDHSVAILHVVIFYLAGAAVMATIDFEKGRKDVRKKGRMRARSGSESPRYEPDKGTAYPATLRGPEG